MENKNNSFKEIWERLKKSKKILLTLHPGPDGDSLGSCAAMKYVLEKNTKAKVTLVSRDAIRDSIADFSFVKEVQFGKGIESCNLKDFDALVFLDHGFFYDYLEKIPGGKFPESLFKINIDHHKTNSYFGDLNYVDTARVSCCSVLMEFFQSVGIKFDYELSKRLLLGICTDSDFFINADTLDSMKKAVFLLESGGVDYRTELYEAVKNQEWNMKKFEAVILDNMEKVKILGKTVVYSTVTKDNIKKLGLNMSEIRTGIHAMKNLKGYDMLFTLSEVPEGIKGSFRSFTFDTALFAEALGGGGHKVASAFTLKDVSLEEAKSRVLKTIEHVGFQKI